MYLTEYDEQNQMAMEREESREEGLREGRKEGQERINRLNQILAEQGRVEDLIRSAGDETYQSELLKEFHL